jgi:hypothetical protein
MLIAFCRRDVGFPSIFHFVRWDLGCSEGKVAADHIKSSRFLHNSLTMLRYPLAINKILKVERRR